jgi:hypoxanthine phosphoribosyltransferase
MITCPNCHYNFSTNARYPVFCRCGAFIKDPDAIKGAGDVVAKVTSAIGISPCGKCNERKKKLNRILPNPEEPRIITLQEMNHHAQELARNIPPGSIIVGVPRSGMIPASIIATLTHSSLWTITRDMVHSVGSGYRFSDMTVNNKSVYIVDDSSYSGHAISEAFKKVSKVFSAKNITKIAVVTTRQSAKFVDRFGVCMNIHYFEWNYPNAPFSKNMGFDLDGTLCRDFTPEEDDDGRRYLKTLLRMKPSAIKPVKYPLRIITARLEKYRDPTMKWLEACGYKVESLVMGPWENNEERAKVDMGAWKAEKFLELNLGDFVESSPGVAKRMAEVLPHGRIACNTNGEIYFANDAGKRRN